MGVSSKNSCGPGTSIGEDEIAGAFVVVGNGVPDEIAGTFVVVGNGALDEIAGKADSVGLISGIGGDGFIESTEADFTKAGSAGPVG